jgi:hypothetical protein
MAHLAFCSNCGSDNLRVGSSTTKGVEVFCYACTAKFLLQGIILGEVDFLAGAKAKVDHMIQQAKQRARGGVASR